AHATNTMAIANDDLLQCLLLVARSHDITTTRETLLSGLPLTNQILNPSVITRAAARAGLTTKLVERHLSQLNSALFPVILLLNDDHACLLSALNGDVAQVIF